MVENRSLVKTIKKGIDARDKLTFQGGINHGTCN